MTVESERVTRKKRIDPLLKAAGWSVAPFETCMDLSLFNKTLSKNFLQQTARQITLSALAERSLPCQCAL